MALFAKPNDGSNLTPTVSGMQEFIGVLNDGFQFTEAARWLRELRGPSKTSADNEATKDNKAVKAARSNDWADELISVLESGIETIRSDYENQIEDAEGNQATIEIDVLVELYGAEAVANALVRHTDERGFVSEDYRLTGPGVDRLK